MENNNEGKSFLSGIMNFIKFTIFLFLVYLYFEFVGDDDENFNFAKIVLSLVQNGKVKLFFLKDKYN